MVMVKDWFATAERGTTLTNPANNVRIAAGTQWVHRGVNTYTSALTNLPTVASKTYHLRWDPTNGFALYDLSSGTYNPSAVPETDVSFDTTYDSMLVARVVTDAANAATITPLLNKQRMTFVATKSTMERGSSWAGLPQLSANTNWARTPTSQSHGPYNVDVSDNAEGVAGLDLVFTRYSFAAKIRGYVIGAPESTAYISGSLTVRVNA